MTTTKKIARLGLTALLAVAATACASTTKVSVQQPTDAALSCAGLTAEFAKLDAIMQEADKNKGVNGANVAAAFLFPLAIVGNYMDADKAEDLVEKRRAHLMAIHQKKGCETAAA